MTDEDKKKIVRLKMQYANATMDEIPVHCEHGFFNTAANRLYYACYYAATAALLTRNLKIKSHDSVCQQLGFVFVVNEQLLTKEEGRLYRLLFQNRTAADYDETTECTRENIEELYPKAKALLTKLHTIINDWFVVEFEETL